MGAMTISRLIDRLEQIRAEHGDLPAWRVDYETVGNCIEIEWVEFRPARSRNPRQPDSDMIPDRVEFG